MKKSTRSNLFLALAYAITLIGGMFLGYKFLRDQGYSIDRVISYASNDNEKVDEIIHIINRNYVDDVDADSLHHLPIDSLLHKLDPHSIYLPAKAANELSESLGGNFEGIGIEYYILNDTLLITNVIKNGPAFAAGLRQGDKILKIDTTFVSGRSLPREKMIGKIKGKKGTAVKLSILHPGALHPVLFTVNRGKVKVSSIDASYLLNPETGYIRISKFGADTDVDFVSCVKNLKAKGMKKLVLDLRDNGGGYLTAATGLANQLLEENKLIVYTQGKHEPRTDYFTTGGGEFEQGKLVILINENSASASEILAGAVQDLNRGVIIGRRSFGKGLVQEQFPFGDGSALNLTIARYYTPSGRSIQKSYKKGYAAYQNEIEDRFNDGELTSERTTTLKDSVKVIKPVVDPGGIRPDIYVKMDTSGYNRFYAKLVAQKVMFDFVYDILASRYTASFLEQNMATFNINDADYKDFVKYIQTKDLVIEPKLLQAARPLIYNDIKVLLCKYHLGDSGYYKALNMNDAMVKQALSSLQ